ncbi:hypothetical protein SRABI84_04690 [Peribacillus simplex]|uniref:DUF5633 domain-containing protein n=1 Tax=Peribacillus simplex TaxID=1478 RepID=UPI001D74EDF7|nr:hypothetical protein SRABI84_04690 [Peribacillus simplex]
MFLRKKLKQDSKSILGFSKNYHKDLINKGWTIQKANGKYTYQLMPICSPKVIPILI